MRAQTIALMGVVERNTYLIKRYGLWELAFFAATGRTLEDDDEDDEEAA